MYRRTLAVISIECGSDGVVSKCLIVAQAKDTSDSSKSDSPGEEWFSSCGSDIPEVLMAGSCSVDLSFKLRPKN